MQGIIAQMDSHFREHPARYTHSVEVTVDPNNRRVNLPDNSMLLGKHIIGLVVSLQNSGDTARTITGRKLVADEIIDCAFLTLKSDNRNTLSDFPLRLATQKAAGATGDYMQLSLPNGYVPSSSYIHIADGPTIPTNRSIQLTFIYQPPVDDCFTEAA